MQYAKFEKSAWYWWSLLTYAKSQLKPYRPSILCARIPSLSAPSLLDISSNILEGLLSCLRNVVIERSFGVGGKALDTMLALIPKCCVQCWNHGRQEAAEYTSIWALLSSWFLESVLTPLALEGGSCCWAPDCLSGGGDWRPWFGADILDGLILWSSVAAVRSLTFRRKEGQLSGTSLVEETGRTSRWILNWNTSFWRQSWIELDDERRSCLSKYKLSRKLFWPH